MNATMSIRLNTWLLILSYVWIAVALGGVMYVVME
jgi:hypothetical protein